MFENAADGSNTFYIQTETFETFLVKSYQDKNIVCLLFSSYWQLSSSVILDSYMGHMLYHYFLFQTEHWTFVGIYKDDQQHS